MKPSEIWMIEYKGDNEKNMFHPFLILYVSNKRILALQFSLLNIDGTSYFGEFRNNNLMDIIINDNFNGLAVNSEKIVLTGVEGMEYKSLADPRILYSFYIKSLNKRNCKFKTKLTSEQFKKICEQIQPEGWEKEIKDMIYNISL